MRILAFVDLHCSEKALRMLRSKVKKEKPGIICCSGDISIVDRGTKLIARELNSMGKQVLIIPGNHEDETNLEKICMDYDNLYYLHKKYLTNNGVIFVGYGTGGFSKVDNSFKPIGENFSRLIKQNKDKKSVLLVHAPPYNTKLDNIMGSSCGNKSFRDFIVKNAPSLVICGHLHENAGKEDYIGETRIINPGPDGMIIKL